VLAFEQFVDHIRASIQQFGANWLNNDQAAAVAAAPHPPTFIVAGPGAGKTTVLALRVLKLILVDEVPPTGIIATTFTRKAAAELRSRILAWGYAVLAYARDHAANAHIAAWLAKIDVNAVLVGTLDSLSEDIISTCRPLGGITPATIEGFLSSAMMRRHGFFPGARHRNADLETFLATFVPAYPGPRPFYVKLDAALHFSDRVRHDQIDLAAFQASGVGQGVLSSVLADYFAYLEDNYFADFARLERLLLDGLLGNTLNRVTDGIRAVLVDEFQDTNYLQEQIYFELCRITGASLTVVGDDDQSIFRFRGATVELFADFENRIAGALGAAWRPQRVDLVRNYRSSARIVNFSNHFIQLDPTYQAARVPGKQALVASAAHVREEHLPVLGMFRQDRETLADDLTTFLMNVFRNGGHSVRCQDASHLVVRGQDGDFGDAVLLSRSAGEYSSSGKIRLPLLLRQRLETAHQIPIFNPRGRSLFQIGSVRRLLGLALACIDPTGAITEAIPNMSQEARGQMQAWRTAAQTFAQSDPHPGGLDAFLNGWRTRVPGNMATWPSEWPLLELLFTLVTWIPEFQAEPEGQVYLEALARTIAEAGQFSSYGARILNGRGVHDANSVRAAIREVFENIANGDVEVDEEIMPYVPRRYFPIMTVHQAKGLEFPLVVVDVGSDFKANYKAQRAFRCPEEPDQVHEIEQIIAPFCPVGNFRIQRDAVDRAWDDLRRLYFVAFSRPQNVLLLVGLTTQIGPNPRVRSVATGDMRQGGRAVTFVPANQWHAGLPPDCVALI
jgi:DNA helicase II / ATP-dependent DNA helicase PcrA